MRVENYFSEPSWGGWTVVVTEEGTFNVGDTLFCRKRNLEFLVEKIAKLDEYEYAVWLSPNNMVPELRVFDELTIVERKS